MRDTLELALTDIVGPEQLYILCDAVQQLEACGLSGASDELQQVIEIADGTSDNSMLVSRVYDVLHYAYRDALAALGVVVDDEAPLGFKAATLESLTAQDYFIIPEQIQALYSGDFTNSEIVGHIIPIFSIYSQQESMDYLRECSDELIMRLKEVIEAKLARQDPDELISPKDNVARLARINKLIKQQGPEQVSVVYELAQAGVRSGRPLAPLLEQGFEQIEQQAPETQAAQLLALVLFSATPLDQVNAVTKALISDYSEDLSAVRRMEAALSTLLTIIES